MEHLVILRIDPATGNRTLIVDSTTTQYFTARQYGTDIMATTGGGELQIINPATGIPTIVSGGGVGSGPDLEKPVGFAIAGTNVLVADQTQGLMSINILTGDRVLLSGAGAGAGPTMTYPIDVAISPIGNLIVSTLGSGSGTSSLMSVDPTTGDRTIISSNSVGQARSSNITAPYWRLTRRAQSSPQRWCPTRFYRLIL